MGSCAVLFLLVIAQIHAHVHSTDEAKYRIHFYKSSVQVPKGPLSLENFLNHACSACYINLPETAFKNKQQLYKYNNESGYLIFNGSDTEYASGSMYTNASSELHRSLNENYITFWTDCCQSAENCSEAMESHTDETSNCMPVWDGLQCWLDPEKSEQDCPSFYEGYITEKPSLCRRIVRKFCAAGEWGETIDYCPPLEFYRWHSNNISAVDDRCCRTELSFSLSYESYKLYTCGKCYVYTTRLHPAFLRFHPTYGILFNVTTGEGYYADLEKNTTAIESTLKSEYNIKSWKDCCRKAVECCDSMLRETTKPLKDIGNFCPPTWDGYTCFGYTESGKTASKACPYYSIIEAAPEICLVQSKKICEKNGSWYFNYSLGKEFTDYSCAVEGFETEELCSMSLYCVSLIFLCAALIPFFYYRQLRVHRITVHKNLFISLAGICILMIVQRKVIFLDSLYKTPAEHDKTVIAMNGPGCKILEVLLKYFELASHFWMLCEGLYLHKLITSAFSEQKNLRLFYVIGWGFPILPVLIYAIVRKVNHDNRCWVEYVPVNWITYTPSLLCLTLNLFFLCNIIRVLITKLRSVQSNEPSYFRKTVRATLILLPLLGIHQLVVGYNPPYPVACSTRHRYTLFKYSVLSLEGFVISFLFCYMNGEVLFLVKRSYQRFRARHSLDARNRSRLSVSTQVSSVADGGGQIATTQA